jgi:uncharacterized protein (TIGR03437 family)
MDGAGRLTTVAGSGNGDSFTSFNPLSLFRPHGVAVDQAGNLYIADTYNHRIAHVILSSGQVSTIAGTGTSGYSGDGGPAAAAQLSNPWGVALDNLGNLYISDTFNNRVRRVVLKTGIISTVAGNGNTGASEDGGQATSAYLYSPQGLALDASGDLYIAQPFDNRIRRLAVSTGIISTVAGNGTPGFGGDSGPANLALLHGPISIAFDNLDNLYIADTENNRIRKVVRSTGIISTFAGTGVRSFGGDGGPATLASFLAPASLALDANGNLFVGDYGNLRIRRVTLSTNQISTIAGNGTLSFGGDGVPATSAYLDQPAGVATNGTSLYIADSINNRVKSVELSTGTITTIAGNPSACPSVITLFPTLAPFRDSTSRISPSIMSAESDTPLCFPSAVALDRSGNLYIIGGSNRVHRLVLATGNISTIVGNGAQGFGGDGGPAINSSLNNPSALALDGDNNLYVADTGNNRVRRVTLATGVISTIAGSGAAISNGDGGQAITAGVSRPSGVAVDGVGHLYISESNRIRQVQLSSGVISTVAGNNSAGFAGDGGPASDANLSNPQGLSTDSSGNLYVADWFNGRIRKITPQGFISTIAGNGTTSLNGDSGPATSAGLSPTAVTVDANGKIYIADKDNNRIRMLTPARLTVSSNTLNFSSAGRQTVSIDSTVTSLGFTLVAEPPSALAAEGTGWMFMSVSGRVTPAILTVDVNPTGLTPGNTYTQRIIVTGEDNNPQAIMVILTIGLPGLSTSTTALVFTVPGSQNVTVGSSAGPISFSTSASASGANWLSVAPGNGITPASLTVTTTPGALPSGSYSGTVTITAPNAANSPQTVKVTLTVAPPTLVSANPQALTFQAPVDSLGVPSQSVQLSSATQNSSFTVGSIPDVWLAVTPTTGQLPGRLSVSINVVGLAPGNYSSKIVIQSAGNPNLVIPVNLMVQQLPPEAFEVQAPGMQFRVGVSEKNPLARVMSVQSHTDQNLTIRAQSKGGSRWLSIVPSQAPVGPGQNVDFQVVVTPSSLPAGILSPADSIVITGGGQVKEVPITVTISDGALPQPLVSTRGITLYAIQGQNNLDARDFLLYNAGSNDLDWFLTKESIYLDISQASGSPLRPFTFQILQVTTSQNVAGLTSAPSPTLNLLFRFAGFDQELPVYLQLLDPRLYPRLPPRATTAGLIVGPPGFVQQTVRLINPGAQPANFTISAPDWLSVASSSKTVPGNGSLDLTVTLLRQPELNPGAQPAITIEFPNYVGNKPYDLNVDLVYLSPSPTSTAARTSGATRAIAAAACSPTRLSAVFTSPGNLFEVPAALPADVIVRVVDDCGKALADGGAIVTFSTGEPAIALSAWPDGTWRGTWQPLLPQNGLVTLRLVATATNNLTPARAIIGGNIAASGNAPIVLSNSVLSSASPQKNNDTIAPGQIISIYGQNLATQAQSALNGVPTTTLGGVQVLLGGNSLPLFYVGPTQINAVVPFTLPIRQSLQLIIQRNGTPSVPLALTVVAAQPGIFTTSQTGSGQGAIIDLLGHVVNSQNPAHRGDIVSIYCEGLGAVDQPTDVTAPAPNREPLPRVTGQVSVIVGNSSAEVLYAGLAPGFYGLYQINVRVPATAPFSDAIPVQIYVANQASNQATMAIR